jgi:signal transduction histidine kinase
MPTMLLTRDWWTRLLRHMLQPTAIMLLTAGLVLLFALTSVQQRQRQRRDALEIMRSTADALAYTIAMSSENAAHAMRRIEDEFLDSLGVKLRLLLALDETAPLDATNAARYTDATGLRLLQTDAAGRIVLAALAGDAVLTNTAAAWLPRAAADVPNAGEWTVFAVRDGVMITSYWRAVAGRTAAGGVLCLIPPASAFAYRYGMGVGPTMARLAALPNVAYVVWEDREGTLSAAGDLHAASEPSPRVRAFAVPALRHVAAISNAVFRIGFRTTELDRIDRSSLVRASVSILVVALIGSLLIGMTRLWQRFEHERAQHERLAALSKLAAGIAHEVRNPLNAVALTLQQLATDADVRASENAELLRIATDEIQRANTTLIHFLEFARPPKLIMRRVNLSALCDTIAQLIQASANAHNITVERDLAPVPDCLLDQAQTHQALLNIALNALDAMPHGGVLTLRTRATRTHVEVEICDTGLGIAPEDRDRIFDLYYTTKHKGVGFGLAFVHRTVTQQHGRIVVVAQVPRGTRMLLTFPAATPDDAGAAPAHPGPL